MVERFFRRIGSLSEKRPWLVIAAILLISIVAFVGLTRLKSEYGYKSMLPDKLESVKALTEADRAFGGVSEEQVLLESREPDGVLNGKLLRKVAGFDNMLKAKKDIWGVLALGASTPLDEMVYIPPQVLQGLPKGTLSMAGSLPAGNSETSRQQFEPLTGKIDSLSDEELVEQVKLNLMFSAMQARQSGFSAGQQGISDDGRALLISVKLNPKLKANQQMKLVTSYEKYTREYLGANGKDAMREFPGITTYMGGSASQNRDSNERTMSESRLLFMLALVFIIIVLLFTFRRVTDTLLTLAVILITVIWVMGLSGWLNFPFTYQSTSIMPLMLGVDIAYAIHVVSRYYEERRKGADPNRSAINSVGTVGVAVFLTAATTAFGFASFGISNMPPIQQFGTLCVAGVLFSFILAITLLPATVVLRDRRKKALVKWETKVKKREDKLGNTAIDRGLAKVAVLSEHHRKLVFGITLAVLIACGLGSMRLTTESSMEKMMPQDMPSMVASKKISSDFGGQLVAFTLVEGDILEPGNLKAMLEFEDALGGAGIKNEDGEQVISRDKMISIADLIQKTTGSIPATKAQVVALIDGMRQGKMGEALARIINKDNDIAMVTIRVPVESQSVMKEITDAMQSYSRKAVKGTNLTMANSGIPVLMTDIMGSLVPTQLKTSGLALILCALIVMLIFNSAIFGLAAASVVFIGIALEIGALAVLNWPLDFMTVMVSSLVIGAGIDFGIHVTHRFLEEWRNGEVEIDEAIRITMANVGKALLAAAVTTSGAFLIIGISGISFLRRFGIITALSLIFALLAALLVLPSILAWRAQRILKNKGRKEAGGDGEPVEAPAQ